MPCLLCGDICRCSSDAPSDAQPVLSPRWRPDETPLAAAAKLSLGIDAPSAEFPGLTAAAEPSGTTESQESAAEKSTAWRKEVAARLNRYQSRRKPRPPRYPSLRLRFEDEFDHADAGISPASAAFQQTSRHALALDEFVDKADYARDAPAAGQQVATEVLSSREATGLPQTFEVPQRVTLAPADPTAKIIEFPPSWTPPPPPLDELAEPVMGRPRILEAPEVVPPPPALGGITIEPVQQSEMEKRPGIDIPLQSAPLSRRILSAAIDDVIIASACLIFAVIFWRMTALHPLQLQLVELGAGLATLFWAAYQYLLMVYAGTTPGLYLARLELARFDGSPASRRLRRWRVLASFLSAGSLAMGYAWVFLDEDTLCWHDRITRTYLAPKNLR